MRAEAAGGGLTTPGVDPRSQTPSDQASARTSGRETYLAALVGGGLAALVIVGFCLIHFLWHFAPGDLSVEGMDTVQAARYLARTGRFGTQIVRPLLASTTEAFPDGAIPDLAHPPMLQILSAVVIRALRHTSVGQGDRETVLVVVSLFGLSIGGCLLLAKRLFPTEPGRVFSTIIILSGIFYVFGTGILVQAVTPTPIPLAVLFFSLMLMALYSMSGQDDSEPTAGPAPYGSAVLAGFLFGLLFLSIYSALLLLPALLFYIWRMSRRELGPALAFLVSACAMAAPLLYRNWNLTGFPLYNARLFDLLAYTGTYHGDGLYRNASLLLPIPQYLAGGGILELVRKSAGNLFGFYSAAPTMIGVFLVPLFLGATLIRFTDRRINQLRGLVYGCIGLHLLGLSFFQKVEQSTPVLLIYTPFIAVLGAAFLVSVVRARNWPTIYSLLAIWGWTALVCAPGLITFLAWPIPANRDTVNTNIYYHLNTDSPEMQVFRSDRSALLVSDAPWDIAYRCDLPAIWLPNDTSAFQTVEEHLGRPIAGVVLTSKLRRDYGDDEDAATYITTYDRLLALTEVASKSDRSTRERLLQNIRVFYPARVADAMQGFQPMPLPEEDGTRYSMLFWHRNVLTVLRKTKQNLPTTAP